MKKFIKIIFLLITLVIVLVVLNKLKTIDTDEKSIVLDRFAILDKNTGDVEWSPDGELIAYCKRDTDDWYFDVWTIRPNGTDKKCLTCDKKLFPKNNGGVTWHPTEDFLVITVQNEDTMYKFQDQQATPGIGFNNNLWAINREGTKKWKLTDLKTEEFNIQKKDEYHPTGVIHPQFSHDGKNLFWAEAAGDLSQVDKDTFAWGKWVLAVAEFVVEGGVPRLENIVKFQPGEQISFYESHDWSPDDQRVLFSGNLVSGQPVNGLDIYEIDISPLNIGLNAKRLTTTINDWDEHAHFSPDGQKITWISGNEFNVKFSVLTAPGWMDYIKTELWIMNSDGSDQKRMTYFNQEGHEDNQWFSENVYNSPRIVVSDNSWSPDGTQIVMTVAYEGPNKQIGSRLILLQVE